MILILFFIAGLVVGWLRGGGLSGLVGMKIRWFWLIILSFIAERCFILLPHIAPQLFPACTAALQSVRFLSLILFVVLNIRNWRICVAGLGIAFNFAAIVANGWKMPVSWQALTVPELASYVSQMRTEGMPEYMLMSAYGGANLWFFSDIIPVKLFSFYPLTYFSPGDFLLGIGVLLTVQHGMAKFSTGRHVRGSLSPNAKAASGRSRRRRNSGLSDQPEHLEAETYMPGEAYTAPVPEETKPFKPVAAEILSAIQENRVTPQPAERKPSPLIPVPPPQDKPAPQPEKPAPKAGARNPEPPDKPAFSTRDRSVAQREQPAPAMREKPAPQKEEPIPAAPAKPAVVSPDLQMLRNVPPARFKLDTEDGASPAGGSNPVKLSPRLETVARMAERGAVVADIGCDHGKLAAWLALNGTPMVIASDVSSKSLAKTKQLVKELGLGRAVQTRVSDGLRKLKPGEADVIVMAGIGGPTICGILEDGRDVAGSASRLVLQPMNAVGTVRKWLTDNGFCITDERLAEEEGRIYQILAAVPGADAMPPMSLFDLEVGHILVDCRHPLLPKLLEYKIDTIDTILSEIADNATPRAEARRSELIDLRERCSQVLEWLAG